MITMQSHQRLGLRWWGTASVHHPRRAVIKCFAGGNGVAVKFVIPYHCRFGQHLCIVGSVDKLGKWDVAKGLALNWSEGDVWRVEVDLPASESPNAQQVVEYKYVVRNSDQTPHSWTPGSNYTLTMPPVSKDAKPGSARLHVRDSWDGTGRQVKVHLPEEETPAAPAPAVAAAAAPAAAVAAPPPPPAAPPSVAAPTAAAAAPAIPKPAPEPPAPAIPEPQPQPQPQQPKSSPRAQAAAAAAAAPAAPSPSPSPKKRTRRRSSKSGATDLEAAEDAALAAITRESERAMQQLDTAITSSWELLDGAADPADPDLLAADRLLAAASQRAGAMAKALDAAAAQRLLRGGSSSTGSEGKPQGRRGRSGDK